MTDVLNVSGLSAGYGDIEVLHGVDFSVAANETVSLIGPNGAGKTSLLKVISGLLPVTAGTVELAGRDATGWSPTRLARAGLCHIPEGRGIFPGLTVRENFRLLAPPGVGAAEAAERAVGAFPVLSTLLDRTAGTLSGGQQQMVAVSRVALGDPELVAIDEASMGLAPIVVDALFEFMASISCAVVIVEQYVDRVLAIADRAYILNRGAIAYCGPADELDADDVLRTYIGVETA